MRRFVMITERDTHEVHLNDGAIIHEQYMRNCTPDAILNRAARTLSLGEIRIMELGQVWTVEEFMKMVGEGRV